jgi:hypothetical protein
MQLGDLSVVILEAFSMDIEAFRGCLAILRSPYDDRVNAGSHPYAGRDGRSVDGLSLHDVQTNASAPQPRRELAEARLTKAG